MSPDLEWRVGDAGGEETLVSRQSPRPPRRRVILGLVIALGAGLGVIYSSLPEPSPVEPTPTPPPTATPAAMPLALYQTIEQEADALARGSGAALQPLLDFSDREQERQLLDQLTPWGRPADQPLFTLIDFDLPFADHAWVDISQYREGDWFRQTRFYWLRKGQWRRTDFDPAFWSGAAETADTPHFHIVYAREDRDLIAPAAAQFEDAYEQVCLSLDCAVVAETCTDALERRWCSTFPRFMPVTLDLRGSEFNLQSFQNASLVLKMPSPRLTGMYQKGAPYRITNNGSVLSLAWTMIWRLAYGTLSTNNSIPDGALLVSAMALRVIRGLQQRQGDPHLLNPWEYDPPPRADEMVELEAVWQDDGQADSRARYYTAIRLLDFVGEEYGSKAMARLVTSVRTAASLAGAIKASTGEELEDFRARWQAWRDRPAGTKGSS